MRSDSEAHRETFPRTGPRLASLRDIFGVDLRTLALFRVLLGLYLIADLVLRARDLSAHYTDFGVLPREVVVTFLSPAAISFHLTNGSTLFQSALFLMAGLFAAMMVIGWRTRAATIASWLMLLSLQNRNPMILSGEDNLAILLLFWAMFLPTGARWSVDAALDTSPSRAPESYLSVATFALLIQGMSVYFFSALLKSDPVWMPDGTAVYYALNLDYFATPFALWFRQFETLLQGLTYYVWTLELLGPILIFSPILHRPLRAVVMVLFITLHVGIWMCLEVGLFPAISIIMNLTFMPGWMWDGLARRLGLGEGRAVRLWYDRDCGFCFKLCRILATFLFLRDVPIAPAQDDERIGALLERENSWVVTDGGAEFLRSDAMRRLFAASPVFWPLAHVLALRPVVWLGDAVYGWIARNRSWLAAGSARLLPIRPVRTDLGPMASTAAALALVLVMVQNVSTLPAAGLTLPDGFVRVRQAFGLYQNWTMFAPYPELTSPWPVIRGELTDGTVVDVYNGTVGEPDTTRPAVVSAVYANYRWRKFLSLLEDQSYEDGPQWLALNYGRYLCRRWNDGTSDLPPLKSFVITFHVEWTGAPGEPREFFVNPVWTHDCFG